MPSLRSLFLHLLALCIISSTVPNVVASPIALQGGLLEARASNPGMGSNPQAVNVAPGLSGQPPQKIDSDNSSDAGSSSDNESSHDSEDDTEEPHPEFKNVPIRLWRTKNEDFHHYLQYRRRAQIFAEIRRIL
ncbi:hypothetical protein F5877DRAFT_65428 [Lentinula edodes]|nr:hypothetical protein F5877DRAFT_65428 [Lentinula edodes]